jgi:hypothetical protein
LDLEQHQQHTDIQVVRHGIIQMVKRITKIK